MDLSPLGEKILKYLGDGTPSGSRAIGEALGVHDVAEIRAALKPLIDKGVIGVTGQKAGTRYFVARK
jgi:hypothetical protein